MISQGLRISPFSFNLLQDAAAATAASMLPSIPGLPSNALTDLVAFLHDHPEVRSAVITFLQADSTKQFLATISSLAIKVNPAQVAGLVRHPLTAFNASSCAATSVLGGTVTFCWALVTQAPKSSNGAVRNHHILQAG